MKLTLDAADLRFINMVAARRFAAGTAASVDEAALEAALGDADGATPYLRAAALGAALLRRRVFPGAPLHTALLTLHCALALEHLTLLAPQGVAAGMVRDLQEDGEVEAVARWLEDRAVPTTSG